MKIWLDDERTPPDESWIWFVDPDLAFHFVKNHVVDEISLDHDLGLHVATGYELLTWIERLVVTENFEPPEIHIHTANPVGHANMMAALTQIQSQTGTHGGTV